MTEKKSISDIKPFRQIPSCDSNEILTITAGEFEVIQNIINSFRAPLNALDSIFNRNLNDGKITIKYVQEDGTEITKEEAMQYIEQAKQFLDNSVKQPASETTATEPPTS